jgi:hypothetical protein
MMYLAFWLRPEAAPNQRVVVCRPFVKKPTIAWAVLRAAVREARTGGVLAGSVDSLKACVDAIEQADQAWPSDPEQMVGRITSLATQLGCTVVFQQNLTPRTDEKVEAAATTKNAAGESLEIDLSLNDVEDVVGRLLGNGARRNKFLLAIKQGQDTLLFYGTKPARTLKQAIDEYVNHVQDRSEAPPEDEPADLVVDRPHTSQCRFWVL